MCQTDSRLISVFSTARRFVVIKNPLQSVALLPHDFSVHDFKISAQKREALDLKTKVKVILAVEKDKLSPKNVCEQFAIGKS